MFAGSVHVKPGEYDARIEAAGGFTGSVAAPDHLSVYEQVPAGALELALFLEAERMAGLADGITAAGLAAARDAIAGEVRAAYVDQPYALVAREVQRALWPDAHRYRDDVLGDGRAVPTATLDGVRAFVRSRIRPGNATLVIAGKLDVAATTALARRYFGWIPDQPVASRGPEPVEPLAAPVTAVAADPIGKVVIAYRLPAPRDPAFLIAEIAGRLLAGGRGSRLHRALVDDGQATAVDTEIVRHQHAGELRITVTSGRATLAELGVAVVREVEQLGAGILEREIESAVGALETDLLVALEGLVYRSDALASWSIDGRSDYLGGLAARLPEMSPLLVREVVSRWLGPSSHVMVIGSSETQSP
jgi:predicted Zn-dependent peptidase